MSLHATRLVSESCTPSGSSAGHSSQWRRPRRPAHGLQLILLRFQSRLPLQQVVPPGPDANPKHTWDTLGTLEHAARSFVPSAERTREAKLGSAQVPESRAGAGASCPFGPTFNIRNVERECAWWKMPSGAVGRSPLWLRHHRSSLAAVTAGLTGWWASKSLSARLGAVCLAKYEVIEKSTPDSNVCLGSITTQRLILYYSACFRPRSLAFIRGASGRTRWKP